MVISVSDALSAYRNSEAGAISGGAKVVTDKSQVFGDVLKEFVSDTVATVKAGEEATVAGALGKASLTEVVTAVSNAELALQTVVTIRDRVIAAYQEIMRTSI